MRARVPEVELGPLKGRGKCGEQAVRVCFVRRRFHFGRSPTCNFEGPDEAGKPVALLISDRRPRFSAASRDSTAALNRRSRDAPSHAEARNQSRLSKADHHWVGIRRTRPDRDRQGVPVKASFAVGAYAAFKQSAGR